MEGRRNQSSYFMRKISKCSLDGDEGLHQLQSRSCNKTTWLPYERGTLEEELAPVISRGFNKTNRETLQKVRKAWEVVQKKDKELRGSNNGPIGGYRRWLKAHVQGLDWLPSLRTAKREEVEAPEEDEEVQALRAELEQAQTVKERFKSAALKIRKENAELRYKCSYHQSLGTGDQEGS